MNEFNSLAKSQKYVFIRHIRKPSRSLARCMYKTDSTNTHWATPTYLNNTERTEPANNTTAQTSLLQLIQRLWRGSTSLCIYIVSLFLSSVDQVSTHYHYSQIHCHVRRRRSCTETYTNAVDSVDIPANIIDSTRVDDIINTRCKPRSMVFCVGFCVLLLIHN